MHRPRALTMGRAQTVGAGIPAPDDDDVLVVGGDEARLGDVVAFTALILQREVLHGEVDAIELAARHGQIAGARGSAGEDERVELTPKIVDGDVDADVAAGAERHAFRHHQIEAPIEEFLFELELRNSVPEESADAIGALEHRHPVPGAVHLIGGSQTCRSGAHHGHTPPGSALRRPGFHPAFIERAVDDRHLDRLDRHGIVVDAEHAGAFARRRTQSSRELREVVRRVEPVDGGLPAIAVDEIVPVGNQVAQWTPLVAERDAAVHAARRLILEARLRVGQIGFVPVVDALADGAHRRLLARDLDEPGDLTH